MKQKFVLSFATISWLLSASGHTTTYEWSGPNDKSTKTEVGNGGGVVCSVDNETNTISVGADSLSQEVEIKIYRDGELVYTDKECIDCTSSVNYTINKDETSSGYSYTIQSSQGEIHSGDI